MAPLAKSDLVAVVGAGAMGAGIAQVAARAGHEVLLYDGKEGAAVKGRAGVLAGLDKLVGRGKLDEADRVAMASRLKIAQSLPELSNAKLVIEAIVENLDIKRRLFAELENVVKPDTILATNTSSLSVTAIAAGLNKPGRLAGLHFFNPAPVMALVEIVSGLATDSAVLQTLAETAKAWGKVAVAARSTPGFIVNRVARPFYAEALRLLEEGAANAPTLDAIVREAGGFRMGPFELMDLIGHDVNFAVTKSVFDACFSDPRYRPSLIQQELVSAGWLGRKSGRGFYRYADDVKRIQPDTHRSCAAPKAVTVLGDFGPAHRLVGALEAKGIKVNRSPGGGYLKVENVTLALSDGRSATQRVADGDAEDLVLFDLALDFSASSRVAVAKADQTPTSALDAAAGLFQALGSVVSVVDDCPGLVVMRTVAMLANEAAEAVHVGIASPADIDSAMRFGLNFPMGPLAWAETIGIRHVLRTLESVQAAYGDDRYRPSLWLRRRAANI